MTDAIEERALTPTQQTLKGLQAVRSVLAPDLSVEELRLFAMVATRSGLDPFAKQVYAIKRKGRVTFQTGIDGYRSIAERTGEYDGQDEPEYGAWIAEPFGHPESATVRVYRKDMGHAVAATAFWDEYYPGPAGKVPGEHEQGQMWVKMPRVMIAKVAEALALRKAFPWDPNRGRGIGGDLYTSEEMAQADRQAPVVREDPRERLAARVAAVEAPVVLSEVVDGEVRQEAVESALLVCPATSKYDGDTPCIRPVGHSGLHRDAAQQTWADTDA